LGGDVKRASTDIIGKQKPNKEKEKVPRITENNHILSEKPFRAISRAWTSPHNETRSKKRNRPYLQTRGGDDTARLAFKLWSGWTITEAITRL